MVVNLPQAHPGVLVRLAVMGAQLGLDSLSGIPGVVVGDFRADVVGYMGLGDPVEEEAVDVAVDGAESASLEVKRPLSVVWKHRVVVLKEGDHDKPVVDVEVGYDVVLENGQEVSLVSQDGETSEREPDTQVGLQDLGAVSGIIDDRVRIEMVGPGWVAGLAGGIAEDVHGPAKELLKE